MSWGKVAADQQWDPFPPSAHYFAAKLRVIIINELVGFNKIVPFLIRRAAIATCGLDGAQHPTEQATQLRNYYEFTVGALIDVCHLHRASKDPLASREIRGDASVFIGPVSAYRLLGRPILYFNRFSFNFDLGCWSRVAFACDLLPFSS